MATETAASLTAAVRRVLQDAASALQEEAIQEALKSYEKKLRAAVHKSAVNVANYYSIERDRENLVITIKVGDGK